MHHAAKHLKSMVPLSIFDGFVKISVRSEPVGAPSFRHGASFEDRREGKSRARRARMPIIHWSVRK
jgi:hypothetical protein